MPMAKKKKAAKRRTAARKKPYRENPARHPIEARLLDTADAILEIIQNDPERVVRAAEGCVNGVKMAQDWVRKNPNAKRQLQNAVMSLAAKFARNQLKN